MSPPRKPAKGPVPTLDQSNLPSTLFALGGLSVSGELAPEVSKKALVFLERCQNFPKGDGGFCASATDPSMNKAGEHVSYGSASSDGLRGLLRCGLKIEDPRVVAARGWVEKHLSTEVHPGDFPEGRYYDRDSLFLYYLWSTAHALAALERNGATLSEKEKAWQKSVRAKLISLQKPDGSWSNPASATREDDPLVATPLAMAVLVLTNGAPWGLSPKPTPTASGPP
jgi:squalene-hopene/tetraprenyl-beta-curcumene cyclase